MKVLWCAYGKANNEFRSQFDCDMRVLWVTNIVFSEVLGGDGSSLGGGWMTSLLDLVKCEVQLGVVSRYSRSFNKEVDGVEYYLLRDWKKEIRYVLESFKPDIIHLHGSEYEHSLIVEEMAIDIPCVCSVQGLVSVYSRYALGGLTCNEILRNITIKDLLRKSGPYSIQKSQRNRGMFETRLFENLRCAIGRTQWDLEHVKSINPNIKYFYCGESLRDCFYDGIWSLEKAIRYTLFCCNSSVPLKGVHQIVRALTIIKQQFPNVCLRIAGKNVLGKLSIKERLKMSGYDVFLRSLIYKLNLQDNIQFLGALPAEEIKKELLSCNTFVLASSIENSPNSLAEAQILGVPIACSDFGGVASMMGKKFMEYTYRFEEYEMLAQLVIRNFRRVQWGDYSLQMQEMARSRHDRLSIKNGLLNIYSHIANG